MFRKSVEDWNHLSKLMAGLAMVVLIVGLGFAINTVLFLQHAVSAKAIIVELVEKEGNEGAVLYAPRFTFIGSDGMSHQVLSSTASDPPIGQVGDKIGILYDPKMPDHARINHFFDLWGVALIAAGLGTFYLLIFGAAVLFTNRVLQRRKANSGS